MHLPCMQERRREEMRERGLWGEREREVENLGLIILRLNLDLLASL